MKAWFSNRIFDDDICYIKSIQQDVLIASPSAATLNIYDNEHLDTSLIMSNIEEVISLDSQLINDQKSGLAYELWLLDRPRMLYWEKHLLCVGRNFYIFQELHPAVDTSNRSIFGAITVRRDFHYPNIKYKFTEKELAIMYLLIHGMTIKQVAELMFISAGTVKGHVWDKIRIKFMNLGFDVPSKDLVVEVGCILGMGDVMPSILIPKIKTSTKFIKTYNQLIEVTHNELDLR